MCFKLHGKEKVLGGLKGVSQRRKNKTGKDAEVVMEELGLKQGEGEVSKPLSKEELERIQTLMDYLNKPSSTYSGKNSIFLSFNYASST